MTETEVSPFAESGPRLDALSFREPDGIGPRGTLLVIPGRGEQPGVYTRFGTRLASDAYRVYVVSDPTVDAEHAKQQLERALEDGEGAPAPVVVVGSDTGALFAAALAAEEPSVPEAADVAAGGAPRGLGGIDALILAGLPSQETDAPTADTWEQELDARTTCPTHRGRISDALVTPGAIYQPVPSDWHERAALGQILQPILAVHGQEDPISTLELARMAYASAPNLELITISGAPHDVLNDQTHRTVAASVVLWLERLRAGNELAAIAHPEPVGADLV